MPVWDPWLPAELARITPAASSVSLKPDGVTTSGTKITSQASTVQELMGLLIKIN